METKNERNFFVSDRDEPSPDDFKSPWELVKDIEDPGLEKYGAIRRK
jgi:hypothetical protein